MATAEAVRLLEMIYARSDEHTRDLLGALPEYVHPADVLLLFDGGGAALVTGMGGTLEIPFDCRIVDARMFVGHGDAASSATVSVWLSSYTDYPSGLLLHGSGTIPTLSAAQKADLSTTGWYEYLRARDVLSWELTSFSGTAERLTLAILVRRVDMGRASQLVTAGGDTIVTAAGDHVVMRT